MLLSSLLLIPILGIFSISSNISYEYTEDKLRSYKITAFVTSILNLILSLVIFILFDFSSNQFQFVQEHYDMNLFDVYLGVDGISIYFVVRPLTILKLVILITLTGLLFCKPINLPNVEMTKGPEHVSKVLIEFKYKILS
jgi:NADH:ubiquinone oxidoreductase subunit 4 (subunit M)